MMRPSWLEGPVVSLTTYVPSCKVPTELLAISVGAEVGVYCVRSRKVRQRLTLPRRFKSIPRRHRGARWVRVSHDMVGTQRRWLTSRCMNQNFTGDNQHEQVKDKHQQEIRLLHRVKKETRGFHTWHIMKNDSQKPKNRKLQIGATEQQ